MSAEQPVYVMALPWSPAWTERARCAEADPELFFPEQGSPGHAARQICGACEVRTDCLKTALLNNEQFGIWGGTTATQRVAARLCRECGAACGPRALRCGSCRHARRNEQQRLDQQQRAERRRVGVA